MRLGILVVIAALSGVIGFLAVRDSTTSDSTRADRESLPHDIYGTVLHTCRADLDLDATRETVSITYRTIRHEHPLDGHVIVMQHSKNAQRVVDQTRGLNPWKLQIADVDGDNKQEIILGVWKKSPKDPVMARRVFVYNWDGRQMVPKWLGSRLSRRFEDFEFRDINKDGWDELLALEVSPGKPKRIGIYRWKSFGFEWLGSAEPEKWEELTK